MIIAAKFSALFSYRVAIRRNCFKRANNRSTRFRVRYNTLSKTPLWRSFSLCGMVTAIWCFRKNERNLRLVYPLSAINRLGYKRFRPVVLRKTAPCSNSLSAIVISCCWPGVSAKVSNRPFPSARTCSLVPKPPRLRPNASASGVLFLPLRHVGGHELSSHPRNGVPNSVHPVGLPGFAVRPVLSSILPFSASAESGCTPSSIFHIVLVNLAKALQFAKSRVSHLVPFDARVPVAPFLVSAVAGVVLSVPIVRSLVRLYRSWANYKSVCIQTLEKSGDHE